MSLARGFFYILIATIFFSQSAQSQDDVFACATDPNAIQSVGPLTATTWTLKVLLVEFSDVRHNTSPYYTYTNFNNLFFSTNVYVSPNMYSPDGQSVSGSMRDYFSIMSDGEFNLTGYVVNREADQDDHPHG